MWKRETMWKRGTMWNRGTMWKRGTMWNRETMWKRETMWRRETMWKRLRPCGRKGYYVEESVIASEFLENIENISHRYYMHGDI